MCVQTHRQGVSLRTENNSWKLLSVCQTLYKGSTSIYNYECESMSKVILYKMSDNKRYQRNNSTCTIKKNIKNIKRTSGKSRSKELQSIVTSITNINDSILVYCYSMWITKLSWSISILTK